MSISLRTERRAFLWRLWPRAFPAESGKTATLDEVISVLEAEHSAGRARVYLDPDGRLLDEGEPVANDKNQLYVAAIERDPLHKVVSLLINRGDPSWVDPALLDPGANAVRVARPMPKEAPGWSAHLVISTEMHGGAHRACFEQMQRVSGSLVLEVIDRIVSRALRNNPSYKYQVTLKRKKGNKIEHRPYRPALEVTRSPSERLVEDLENGSLGGVILRRDKTDFAGVGIDQYVRKIEEKVFINVRKMTSSEASNFLLKIMPQAKKDYSSMQVQIFGLPGNQSSSPTIPLSDQEAFDHLYVRAKRLTDFKVILEQCYDVICKEIKEKLVKEIHTEANWPH